MHGGQRLAARRADQGPFGDRRGADASADRGGDGGERQVQTAARQVGPRHADLRRRLCECGLGVVEGLAADRIDVDQPFEAVTLDLGLVQGRLCALQGGLRAFDLGAERGRIDLVQRLARTHRRAFSEQTTLDDAADLRADFSDTDRDDPPRQGVAQLDQADCDGGDADFGRGRRRSLVGAAA